MLDLGHAAMEQVVRESDDAAVVVFGHQRKDRFMQVEEALPRCFGDVLRERRLGMTAIEGVVSVPKRTPCRVVVVSDRPDGEAGHGHGGVSAVPRTGARGRTPA
jgi:hypothetical protein